MSDKENRTAELIREVRESRVPYGMIALWFLGQCGVIGKAGDTTFCVDPYLSPAPYRSYPPIGGPELLAAVDYVLITHDHIDHLDADTLKDAARIHPSCRFLAPGVGRNRMIDLGIPADWIVHARTGVWWEAPGIRVKPLPSAHETFEYTEELDHRYVGYVVASGGVTLYHAGDTVVYPGMADTLHGECIDVGLLPINGRDLFRNALDIAGNMNVREAAELAVASAFDLLIPTHYDMFAANGEWPGSLVDYLYQHHPSQKCQVLARYQRFVYVSGNALKLGPPAELEENGCG